MFFSANHFQIHKNGKKYCLNDVVFQCELSTNPNEYIKKIDDKTLHKSNYYINKKTLVEILTKAKAPKSKELLELLKNKNDINTTYKQVINFVDNGNNTIHFNGEIIKYFNNNNQFYFKAKEVAKILGYSDTKSAIQDHLEESEKIIKDDIIKGGGILPLPYKSN